MSKKNFAKKFVAYTMAFAVAFGTVNVSPIFVKDAQAALKTTTTVKAYSATLDDDNDTVIADGVALLGEVESTNANSTVTLGDVKTKLGIN